MILNPQAKLLWHGDRVKKFLETGKISPVLAEVMPSGICNANCPSCFFKNNRGKFIKKETMIKFLRQSRATNMRAINWSGGGEPTLHPDFYEFVELADKLGFEQGLYTNAYNEIKMPDIFKWIRITLTDKEYSSIKLPKSGNVGICVNQIKEHTIEQIDEWCCRAKELGVNYFQIRPALETNYKDQPKLKVPDDIIKHSTENFEVIVTPYKYEDANKPFSYEYCYGYHFCTSVDWNGNLIVCPYMGYDKRFVLGDLKKENFSDIWARIPKKVKVLDICQHCCKNHEINKILDKAKNIKQVNFI